MIIKNGNIVFPDRIKKGDILINEEKITDIMLDGINEKNTEADAFDAEGLYVCPGFIDIHTHGGGGVDFLDDTSFDKALAFHLKAGTTSLLPTALTSPRERICGFAQRIRDELTVSPVGRKGSRILGAHIEGPYLSLKNKGAQPESCILVPSRDSYDFLTENADVIKTVTISPELDGGDKMVSDLKKAGIIVCGGHDNGKKSTLMYAIDAGISHVTHIWCATSTVAMYDGTREPGLCEIGLTDDRLTVEMIADNHHLPPELVKIIYRCKGAKKACLVSDCLRAGGEPADGRLWVLGREEDKLCEFIVSDGVARLPDNTRLAGSIQPVSRMVKNIVDDSGIPLVEAVRMASLTPAEIIGVNEKYGSIEAGKTADFCILDKNLCVRAVFLAGVHIY